MEEKPYHYDGSMQNSDEESQESIQKELFQISDEMRKSISGNPFTMGEIK